MARLMAIAFAALAFLMGGALTGAKDARQEPPLHRFAAEPRTGQIEGRVFDLPQVAGLPRVVVRSVELYRPSDRFRSAEAIVGEDGRFVIENAPAGPVRLRPVFDVEGAPSPVTLPTLTLDTAVRAGKTTHVSLFGRGRPITGQITLPGGIEPRSVRVRLTLTAPPLRTMRPSPRDGRPNPMAQVYERVRTQDSLEGAVDAEGRFRIEGVREGTYHVTAVATSERGEAPRLLLEGKVEATYPAIVNRQLRVPLMADGESDKPLDLGLLRFGLRPDQR